MTGRKRIAIVGGGPAGLAAAKALGEEPGDIEFVDLFEHQQQLGGLWNYSANNKDKFRSVVPCSKPRNGGVKKVDDPLETVESPNNGYVSPMYEHLETNIVKDIMMYSDFPFPTNTEAFPSRADVANYLQAFAKTINTEKIGIHLNCEVKSIEKSTDGQWKVDVFNYVTKSSFIKDYDVIIIANGHFQTPFIPEVHGLVDWETRNKNSITHAKYFINAEEYRGKNVVVVGNSASGIDISTQLSTVAKSVYLSSKAPDKLANLENPRVKDIAVIKSYNQDDSITTIDGQKFNDIDNIIFCTGYLYDISFLKSYKEQLISEDGRRINNLYKDIFFIEDPSLIFIALSSEIIPMPFSEAQAVYVARVLSGRLKLPSILEMKTINNKRLQDLQDFTRYHSLGFPHDVDYMQSLINEVKLINDNKGGHQCRDWNDRLRDTRRCSPIRKNERLEEILDHALKLHNEGRCFYLLREKEQQSCE